MGERIAPGSYFQYPPPPPGVHASPLRSSSSLLLDRERYLAELMAERQTLRPFVEILPNCIRLMNHEIGRVSSFNQKFLAHERVDRDSSFGPFSQHSYGRPMDLEGWSATQMEENGPALKMGSAIQYPPMGWRGVHEIRTPTVKKIVKLDVPVDQYPTFNFVGRILGPRGNSLKRVEAMTECRVYIRGKGSVKDSVKEEELKDKPGFEHLTEPLHVLVEADLPEDVVDAKLKQAVAIMEKLLQPMDESVDHYKKNQLRELAMLNGTLREEAPSPSTSMSPSPSMSPSMSPFNSTGMKRAKTGR